MRIINKITRNRWAGASIAIVLIAAIGITASFVQDVVLWDQMLRDEDTDRLNEQIQIESVYYENESLNIDVRNTGSVYSKIVAVWLNDDRYDWGIDHQLDIEELKTIEIEAEQGVKETFTISVFTERGNSDTETFTLSTT